MNQMGKSQIGYRNDSVPRYYSWSPGGFGCSNGCDGCWAKAMSRRLGDHCPKCKAFEVHLHEERLCLPACTNPPGVVLVNFMCDTFDKDRSDEDVVKILRAIDAAPYHNYVLLTKNPSSMACWDFRSQGQRSPLCFEYCVFSPNVFLGLSICNQQQADEKIPAFLEILGRKWISFEPLWESLHVPQEQLRRLEGAIIGHDNRKGKKAPLLNDIIGLAIECRIAEIPVYIKQAWLRYDEAGREITELAGLWNNSTDAFRLVKDAKELEAALPFGQSLRDLPWSMPEVKP